MPIQGFNTGVDLTLAIVTPNGVLTLNGITGFQSQQMTQPLDHKGINGVNDYATIPTGWEGSFDIDRTDSGADDFFAAYEATYYAKQDPGTVTITQTITEISGQTQYRYNGVALTFSDSGTWRGDAKVQQKISFRASSRIKVQ